MNPQHHNTPTSIPTWDTLTERERQVLALIAAGHTNSEIADRLGIAFPTAKNHVSNILTKLGVDARADAAAWWREHGNAPAPIPARRRWWRALSPLGLLRIGGALAGLAVLASVTTLAIALWASRGDDTPPAELAIPSATPTASSTATPTPPPIPDGFVLSDGTDSYSYTPQLAYIGDDGWLHLYDFAAPAEQTVLIENCGGVHDPERPDQLRGGLAWSPDGSRVACPHGDGSVSAVRADGTDRTEPFAAGECTNWRSMQWATGGATLTCRNQSGLLVKRIGGELVLQVPGQRIASAWSPDGRFLAYTADTAAPTLVIVTANGHEVASFDGDTSAQPAALAWTRDGSMVAFRAPDAIVLLETATGSHEQIALSELGDFGQHVAGSVFWLDDGQELGLLNVTAGQRSTLGALDIHSTELTDRYPLGGGGLIIAPDHHRIATLSYRSGGLRTDATLTMTNLDGDHATHDLLTYPTGGLPNTVPPLAFAGDSSRLCAEALPVEKGGPPVIHCGSSDGTAQHTVELALHREAPSSPPLPAVLTSALSPDMTRVAYVVQGSETPDPLNPPYSYPIAVASIDTGETETIALSLGYESIAWRPDGVWRQPVLLP